MSKETALVRMAMNEKPGASAQAIQHHYDAGDDFYQLWLDETRTYSCALWDSQDESLESAQFRKLDYHIAQARAHDAERVLDVGCGWGSLAQRLVRAHGVQHVTGLTLSASQKAYIERQAWPGVEVRLENWFDHAPTGPYDAILSIGAFEHFARPSQSEAEKVQGYRDFFRRCHGWLKPGGWLSLQTMSYENSRREDFSDFFNKEIFPESDLPRLSEIAQASDRLFEIVTLRNDREHYARTLQVWRHRMKAHRAAAVAQVGESVVARYDRYLQLAMIGFHVGTMGLLRIAFRRLDRSLG
ncbi:cyclopropane-fatty-acyl-phospholipid synthase family protein [Sorangium sp. So ce260]|uniref:class I SAM-dependent methyltransferase n=1 Tax=Sorangium sp. So ce260 TaxID=3133291 RepID=UPI003F5DF716